MILKECKRLAEVDSPIAELSRQSARQKSICQAASVVTAAAVGCVAVDAVTPPMQVREDETLCGQARAEEEGK